MQSFFRLAFLTLGSFPFTYGQLHTISILTHGATPTASASASTSTSTSSSLSTSSSSSSISSSSLSSTSSTVLTSTSTSDDPLVLTTVFTQPSGCNGGITQVATWSSTELWQNAVHPVSTLALSSCYPSQFYYSAAATTRLPQYSQLVCPLDWETYQVTDTDAYIICCPSGYGVYAPDLFNTYRPGMDAFCTSSVGPDELMDITSYDSAGLATVIPTKAGENGTWVFATAFDGTAATAVADATSSISSTTATSAESTSAATNSTSAASTSAAHAISTMHLYFVYFYLGYICLCYFH